MKERLGARASLSGTKHFDTKEKCYVTIEVENGLKRVGRPAVTSTQSHVMMTNATLTQPVQIEISNS
jgi:hypothetical protein